VLIPSFRYIQPAGAVQPAVARLCHLRDAAVCEPRLVDPPEPRQQLSERLDFFALFCMYADILLDFELLHTTVSPLTHSLLPLLFLITSA
jgi:hypothetical protein